MPKPGLVLASVGTIANETIKGRKFMLKRIWFITASVAMLAALQ